MNPDSEYTPLFVRGVELFNDCEFYECHDVWEELWAEYRGPSRTFYQGLIQTAVALHHFCNGNIRGARKLYHGSRKYLEPFRPHHIGINLDQLFSEMEACFQEVVASDEDFPSIDIDADLIPDIVLDPPPASDSE